ncbi:hypothetical protein G3I15_35335 [Streptomyces sp. SID10244]|nr:hypothetical protein [Streptomyces sp. SID10244]
MSTHAEIREPFAPRFRAKPAEGRRYTELLPDPKVPTEQAEGLADDARMAGISLGEALRQLVDRCLEQSQ